MVISSNALFHFTRSMDDLVSILKYDFVPRLCLENYSDMFGDQGKEFTMAFPMVCFCDLPISQLRGHMEFYGSYGLGMKKEWGIKNGISPVLYMQPGSNTAADITGLLGFLDGRSMPNEAEDYRKHLRSIIRQIKLYEGYVEKDGQQVPKRFYDEREWRWVPCVTEGDGSDLLSLTDESFRDLHRREPARDKASKTHLVFEPADIDYIIVAGENEIPDIIEAVESFRERYDAKTVRILTSRIISAERIKSDF